MKGTGNRREIEPNLPEVLSRFSIGIKTLLPTSAGAVYQCIMDLILLTPYKSLVLPFLYNPTSRQITRCNTEIINLIKLPSSSEVVFPIAKCKLTLVTIIILCQASCKNTLEKTRRWRTWQPHTTQRSYCQFYLKRHDIVLLLVRDLHEFTVMQIVMHVY